MAERRSLTDGLARTPTDQTLEQAFVFQEKGAGLDSRRPAATSVAAKHLASTGAESEGRTANLTNRAPLTTRLRADYAAALKRASLERQLQGAAPNTVQEILEAALEPWLRTNGYLS